VEILGEKLGRFSVYSEKKCDDFFYHIFLKLLKIKIATNVRRAFFFQKKYPFSHLRKSFQKILAGQFIRGFTVHS
jgi:hypothetical protein